MTLIESSHNFLRTLCTILGIDPDKHPVHRIVIDAEAASVIKVYVERFATKDEMDNMLNALKEGKSLRPMIEERIFKWPV